MDRSDKFSEVSVKSDLSNLSHIQHTKCSDNKTFCAYFDRTLYYHSKYGTPVLVLIKKNKKF